MASDSVPSPIPFIETSRANYTNRLANLACGDVLIVNLPNRFGKTVTALKYYETQPVKVLYLSDRHEQMNEIIGGDNFRHWYGLKKICEKKDEPFIGALIGKGFHANIICRNFCNTQCSYKNQFQVPEEGIVVAPKEYLPTTYVQNNHWDVVILDENIEKAKKIQYTHPNIPLGALEDYRVNVEFYKDIGRIIEGDIYPDDLAELQRRKTNAGNISGIIKMIRLRGDGFRPTRAELDILNYLNNLDGTIEWIQYYQRYGRFNHFYKPFLHYAHDLRCNFNCKLILLNTSYDEWIYNQLMSRYEGRIVEPQNYNQLINNKKSILLHYNSKNRSLAKDTITQRDGTKLGKLVGKEINQMLKNSISFSYNRSLKVGIITYKSLTEDITNQFEDKTYEISYFGGHQGSNKFEDVDVLIIVGTFHLNPSGLYKKHYVINNEYLADDHAVYGGRNNKIINGMQINLTDNDRLNKVKLYKLNEEHQQAIFRSGAHVKPGKLVISFGYVPQGIEDILTYKTFNNKNQLNAYLNVNRDNIGTFNT
ncbi:hypothetical protein [Methanobacterium spitsbergense]|uniref:Uncharacterized protein n=1 Tax=Methanobacterium spitsbergense TaxID=2874285 RepID=A0A8T5V051_9EURY|nr:hypothetical protein [Methanobacterium spitsbergense]MBZ2165211.1 hypothetical protein [Methanobacterium spitsbergense]